MSQCVWIVNQYASTPGTGVGGRHFYLARELAKQGYKVYLIASASHHLLRKKVEFNELFKIEAIDGFNVIWVNMPHYTEAHSRKRVLGWFLFSSRIKKLRHLIQDKPDAILASSPSLISYLGARLLARKFQARLVFEVRDIWPLTLIELGGFSINHPFIRLMQWIEDKAYQTSDAVISNLKYSVDHMVSRGMDEKKFTWIPNGYSKDEVGLKAELDDEVDEKIPKEKFIVGYAGTLGFANSLDTLILAAKELCYIDDIKFLLVGDGKEKKNLKRMVEEEKISNVIFLDPIPKVQIQSMLNNFNVCYLGLTKDPLFRFGVSPNKLFDYMYAGKPIIYAIDSGKYTPVSDASAGLQIPAQDHKELANSVLALYKSSSGQRSKMGSNAKVVAENEYEYSALSEKLAKVLFVND